MRTIRGKSALVTGAAAGIGRAVTLELARAGANLLLVDVEANKLAATAAEARSHAVEVTTLVADLALPSEVSRLVAVVRRAGGLDILVNNAGVAYYGTTHEMSARQWRLLVDVNLLAPLQLTHELLPTLFERSESHVLNMCSIAGLVGVARLSAYNTSKFALIGFSESLRAEYGGRGIGVTALCPGLVQTDMFRNAMTGGDKRVPRFPGWLLLSPERVARRAVRAIRKNEGLVVMSGAARLIWWTQRLLPGFLSGIQQWRRVRRPAVQPAVSATLPSCQPEAQARGHSGAPATRPAA